MPIATHNDQMRQRLTAIRAGIQETRNERAVVVRERDEAKAAFASSNIDLSSATVTRHPTYKRAEASVARVSAVDAKLGDLQAAEKGVLAMLGAESPRIRDGNGPRDGGQSAADADKPGTWLSEVLRANGGGGIMATLTTAEIGSMDVDRVFFTRLQQRSALLSSGISIYDTDASSVKVGEITGDMPPAVPTAETDPIAKSDPPLNDREIKPPKFPVLTTLSKEAFDDARPIRVAAVENKMVQAIGVGFDAAGFNGASTSLHPGMAHTTGVASIPVDVGDTAYDWLADAVGVILNDSGLAGLLFISPFTARTLLKLKDGEDRYRIETLQDAASALMGVPVRITKGVLPGEAFVVDPRTLLIVRRADVEIQVFDSYDVDHAIVAVRAMMRAQLVVVDPGGIVHITGLPVPTP
jgi:HK97 family phage major capsid protein